MRQSTFLGKYKFNSAFVNAWNNDIMLPINMANPKWKYKFTCDTNLISAACDKHKEYVDSFTSFLSDVFGQYFGHGNSMPWFRGQANKDWVVVPGFLREEAVQTIYSSAIQTPLPLTHKLMNEERHIMKKFIMASASFRPDVQDICCWYALAQHYGLPTRLLDWTTSPLTALWMALENGSDEDDGIFISINPNGLAGTEEERRYWTQDNVNKLIRYLCGEDFSSEQGRATISDFLQHEAIIPYYPNISDGRLVNQQARFTLHTPANTDAETPCTLGISDMFPINEYIIPKEAKPHLRNFLLMLGIQHWHIMPDLEHVAMGIRNANFVTRKTEKKKDMIIPTDKPAVNGC